MPPNSTRRGHALYPQASALTPYLYNGSTDALLVLFTNTLVLTEETWNPNSGYIGYLSRDAGHVNLCTSPD
jgi:hypothetical protein